MQVIGYKKKTKVELLKAVDDCVSISQLFALVQHEGLVLQMQSLPGASNISPKKLSTGEAAMKSPIENLKNRVKTAIVCQRI
ncbi:MAG: hypothetical protein Q4A12_01260 [Eubacteriales bacterium]|nr:hypothetical protein [Eubacteriales bacterium]